MIKLLLTGDLHTNVARRSEEARRVAYWIVNDGKARGVHFIGIGGDCIDGPMTEKDRDWLIEFGDYCASIAPTFFLMGNHEPELSLRCLRGRHTKYPLIVEEGAGVHIIQTDAGPLAVAGVAFPYKAKLLAAVGPKSDEEVDLIMGRALQDVFRGLGVRVRELGLPTVGLLHGTIRGSKIGADDQPDRPLGMDIDIADIALMNCDFVCAPHIHKANQFEWDGRVLAASPTSPFYTDYGEAKHEKGYILAEFTVDRDVAPAMQGDLLTERDGPAHTHVEWVRIATPATPMILIEAFYGEGGWVWRSNGDITPIPTTEDLEALVNGADVRLRYEVAADQRKAAIEAAADMAGLFQVSGAVNVKVEEIVTPTTKARIPGLSKAKTLHEKLLMYWESIDFIPDTARRLALAECLSEIQEEAAAAGLGMGTAGRTSPAIRSVRGKGFLKFPNEFAIDFRPLGDLTTIVAPNECLAGDTLVDVPRDLRTHPDGIPIRDLVGTSPLVYSYDGERLVVARACNVRKTGTNRDVYRVTFNAEAKRRKRGLLPPMEIKATGDHEFMLRDGSYRMVRDLLPGDSLMPLYRNKEGAYIQIHRNDGTMEDEHRMVGAFIKGRQLLTSEHAHHDDENTWNNSEENIKVLTASEHARLHSTGRPPTYEVHPRGMAGKQHTQSVKDQISASLNAHWTPEKRQEHSVSLRAANPRVYDDKELLTRLYVDEGLSSRKIAAQLGTSFNTVLYSLKHHGIERRANHKVVSIQYVGAEDVYDLEVPRYHNFVANGVVVHNCGKTLLMQLMGPGVLYGKTPTRGSLDDLSVAKDSFIEVAFEMGGAEYVLTQNINGMSRTGSVSLLKNGLPELSKAGRAEYKEWADKFLLPSSVYDAVICQSGTESVIDLKEGPRVELLLRVLGLEAYEVLAEKARKRATAIEGELSQVRAKISALDGGQTPEYYVERIAKLQADLRTANEDLRLGEITLADLRAKNDAATLVQRDAIQTVLRIKEIEARENGLAQRISEMKRKIDQAKTVVAEADAINAAVATTKDLVSQLAELSASDQEVDKQDIARTGDWQRLEGELDRLVSERTRLQTEAIKLDSYLAGEATAKAAETKCAQLALDIKQAILSLDLLTNELEIVRGEGTTTLSASRAFLRGELQYIADEKAKSPKDYAYSALDADAKAVQASEDHPAKVDQAKRRVLVADSKVKDLEKERVEAQRTADRLVAMQEGIARSNEAMGELKRSEARLAEIETEQEAVRIATELLTVAREANLVQYHLLSSKIEALKPLVDKVGLLAEAETRAAEHSDRLAELLLEKTKLIADQLELTNQLPAVAPIILDLAEYVTAIDRARATAMNYQTALTQEESNQKAATEMKTKRDAFAAQIKPLEATMANWTLLGLHLGKDALQKAEIADSGSTLTAITNDLLRLAGDTRHTVSIETEKLHSDKKRMIPTLDINVWDAEEGQTKESRRLSDAGKIIVGWPLSLALIKLGCDRAGIKGPTIFIDEATGPCDTVNGPRCASMLRHFAEDLGSQVIYIAQQPEIQAFADSTIRIANGTITVS